MHSKHSSVDAILLFDEQERFATEASARLYEAEIRRILVTTDASRLSTYLDSSAIQILIFGLYPPFATNFKLIEEIRQTAPSIKIIVVSTGREPETAITCMKLGACDYLQLPLDFNRLVASIGSLNSVPSPSRMTRHLPLRQNDFNSFNEIVTNDRRMQSIFRYIEAIAPTSQAVLITGETGTGKELIAKSLHEASGRSGQLVTVNVAGLDDIMFSDTLFGHERGAFTGADRDRKGLIEKAAEGTLFLDEIGDLSIASQVKLLRLLQEGEYYPLGSDTLKITTARIVVATNSNLEQKIANSSFRNDLYYRLCSHHISLPPLRERRGDIPLLVDYFVKEAAADLGRDIPIIPAKTLEAFQQYSFPGNIRELRGMVRNGVTSATCSYLTFSNPATEMEKETVPSGEADFSILAEQPGRPPTLEEAEFFLIRNALQATSNNRGAAAAMLGISRQALSKRLLRTPKYLQEII